MSQAFRDLFRQKFCDSHRCVFLRQEISEQQRQMDEERYEEKLMMRSQSEAGGCCNALNYCDICAFFNSETVVRHIGFYNGRWCASMNC